MQVVFDVAVAGLVVLSAAWGAWKGFARQMAAVLSPLVGLGAGLPLSARLAPHFGAAAPLNRWIALLVLYLLLSFAVHLLAAVYRKLLDRCRLDGWDRHAGGVCGALLGFVFCLILTAAAASLSPRARDEVRGTRAGRVMGRVVTEVEPALPGDVRRALSPFLRGLLEPPDAPMMMSRRPSP